MIAQADAIVTTPLTQEEALTRAFDEARGKLDKRLYGSLERANAIVKHGGVTQNEAGQWWAQRETDPEPCPVNGACSCPQAKQAVQHLCEHRLAVGLVVLRNKLLAAGLPDPVTVVDPATAGHTDSKEETLDTTTGEILDDEPVDPDLDAWQREEAEEAEPDEPCALIEARGGRRRVPKRFLQVVHGIETIKFVGLLYLAHKDGLLQLKATFVANEDNLSIAQAVAVFADGRAFADGGDSTKENGVRVGVHWRRLSLTRAKSRCLKDALGITLVSAEELDENNTSVQAAPESPVHPDGEGWCDRHTVQMPLQHGKDGSEWYSHKLTDGKWCKGK